MTAQEARVFPRLSGRGMSELAFGPRAVPLSVLDLAPRGTRLQLAPQRPARPGVAGDPAAPAFGPPVGQDLADHVTAWDAK